MFVFSSKRERERARDGFAGARRRQNAAQMRESRFAKVCYRFHERKAKGELLARSVRCNRLVCKQNSVGLVVAEERHTLHTDDGWKEPHKYVITAEIYPVLKTKP